MRCGLPFVITEDIDPTDSGKARKITEYFETLSSQEKTDVYNQMLSKPMEEYLSQTAGAYMEQFNTWDDMIDLVVSTYDLILPLYPRVRFPGWEMRF